MKKKVRIALSLILFSLVLTINTVYADVKTSTTFEFHNKYRIIVDNEKLTIPSSISFPDGYSMDLEKNYKTTLNKLAQNTTNVTFNNNILTVNGIFITKDVESEFKELYTKTGMLNPNLDRNLLEKYTADYFIKAQNKFITQLEGIASSGDSSSESKAGSQRLIDMLKQEIAKQEEIVKEMEEYDKTDAAKGLVIPCAVPWYVKSMSTQLGEYSVESANLEEKHSIKYYLYSIIYRDLRINNMSYKVNGQEAVKIANFDKDKYTYNVALSPTTPKNAQITTESKLFMDYVLDQNKYEDYELDTKANDVTVTLNNGKATAKVKVVFNPSRYAPDAEYSSSLEREYTINFTVSDYLKGDLDRNGQVDTADAAVALNLFKYKNFTDEDIAIGDMDENGIIDTADAAEILNVFKYKGNV